MCQFKILLLHRLAFSPLVALHELKQWQTCCKDAKPILDGVLAKYHPWETATATEPAIFFNYYTPHTTAGLFENHGIWLHVECRHDQCSTYLRYRLRMLFWSETWSMIPCKEILFTECDRVGARACLVLLLPCRARIASLVRILWYRLAVISVNLFPFKTSVNMFPFEKHSLHLLLTDWFILPCLQHVMCIQLHGSTSQLSTKSRMLGYSVQFKECEHRQMVSCLDHLSSVAQNWQGVQRHHIIALGQQQVAYDRATSCSERYYWEA